MTESLSHGQGDAVSQYYLLSFDFLLALGDFVLGSLKDSLNSSLSEFILVCTLFSGSNWKVLSKSALAASQSLRARCASPRYQT